MSVSWEAYYQAMAEVVKMKSKDIKTKIGAVIVGEGQQVISTGYNSYPRGIRDDVAERQERPEKYFWFEHGERNALYCAARNGVSTVGATMYLSCGVPCTDCARGIINAGIVAVWAYDNVNTPGGKWDEHAKRSLIMFEEAGINVFYYQNNVAKE